MNLTLDKLRIVTKPPYSFTREVVSVVGFVQLVTTFENEPFVMTRMAMYMVVKPTPSVKNMILYGPLLMICK